MNEIFANKCDEVYWRWDILNDSHILSNVFKHKDGECQKRIGTHLQSTLDMCYPNECLKSQMC